MKNKAKGAIGCVNCGTSLGCFFPLALVLGVVLIVAASSYFDASYRWDDTDTWMVVFLTAIVIPAFFVGILQAAIGVWGLLAFFDDDVKPEALNLLTPIPLVDGKETIDKNRE